MSDIVQSAQERARQRAKALQDMPDWVYEAYLHLRERWMPNGKVEDLNQVRNALADAWIKSRD